MTRKSLKPLAFLFLLALLFAPLARADAATNKQTIYAYLTETLGLNRAAACGILSNIRAESNFNPEAVGDGGEAYGICQWNSRRNALINYCANQGFESWTSLEGQLGYLAYELENNKKSVGAFLKTVPNTAQGAYDAAYHFCVYYEIPGNRYAKGATRGANAVNAYWTEYGGTVNNYPVTYDANGGENAPAAQVKKEGIPFLITTLAPARAGYTLAGWAESAEAKDVAYTGGDTFTENRALALYAVWERALDADAPCDGKTTWNGNTYEYYKTASTWAYAREFAARKGGRLASVRSAGEYAAVSALIASAPGACWLGGVYTSGNWTWDGGEVFSDAFAADHWADGSPYTLYGASAKGRLAQSADGLWLDMAADSLDTAGFVVEYGSAEAEEYPAYVINASTSLNLREGPGTSYGILSAMLPGTLITISDIWEGANYDWGWGVTNTGARGWCAVRVPNYMTPAKNVDAATGIAYEIGEGGAKVTGYAGSAASLSIPDALGGQPVIGIAANAFTSAGAPSVISVPDGVLLIAPGAFAADVSLRGGAGSSVHRYAVSQGNAFSIIRPDNALTPPPNTVEIGASAFEGAKALTFIDLSQTKILRICAGAFLYCDQLTAVLLPESAVFIADTAFPADTQAVFVCAEGSYAYAWAQAKGYDTLPYAGERARAFTSSARGFDRIRVDLEYARGFSTDPRQS